MSYGQLTDNAKQYDRESSIETLKVIQALGYAIHPKGASLHPPPASTTLAPSDDGGITQVWDVEFGVAAPQGETYVPKPITTTDIDLSSELTSLVELLAENSHDVWAKKRMHEGWVYGPRRNDATKEHDGLVPYVYLTSEEKDMDRNSAVQTVKCILRCGFTFQHKRTNARAKFRMFGGQPKSSEPDLKPLPPLSAAKESAVQSPVPSTPNAVIDHHVLPNPPADSALPQVHQLHINIQH
ncbi:hypothetical protein AaE_004685 [Aphanomyces astaci]|uniref:Ryanodine receptor Ryr domain-containing protein n=1 Tax=Aphanomyces astaci TaxID=112090 RepID=A0A6A5AR71_APHAT|nr:hypothetical protein AaE_004685 [Aphanomyces astaci]